MSKNYAEKSPKKQQSALRIISIIALVLSFLVFLMFFAGGDTEYRLIDAQTNENITQLNDKLEIGSDIVEFKELTIVDKYATYGNPDDEDAVEQAYYLTLFYNNDKPYYASVCCDVDSNIYNSIEKYVNDENSLVGDMIIPICAVYRSHEDDALKYYQECADMYNEALETDVASSGLELEYVFDTASQLDEYKESQKNENTAVEIGALVIFVLSLVGIILTTVKIKRIKKAEAESAVLSENVYYQADSIGANQEK